MADMTLTEDEREALWQASLSYWRSMPWWIADDLEHEAGEREVFLGGQGRNIAAAVETIVAARVAAALGEVEARTDAVWEDHPLRPECAENACSDCLTAWAIRDIVREVRGEVGG